mmetsp:Transcript_72771/g.194222  ORF Transcript_72771/g.194222 Transcript_72771/m.194222 type:complete len:129 (+) Transcript_72771:93-479(+)
MAEEDFAGVYSAKKAQVDQLLTQGNAEGALAASLQNPPFACKDDDLKKETARMVVGVLAKIKEPGEIMKAINALDPAAQDALMKYIYRGWDLAQPSKVNAALLTWHAQMVSALGKGIVCRAVMNARAV